MVFPAVDRTGSRGPSPLRPHVTPYRDEALSPIDRELHPTIHAGRVAVITGAASGIGRAAAIELAKFVSFVVHFIIINNSLLNSNPFSNICHLYVRLNVHLYLYITHTFVWINICRQGLRVALADTNNDALKEAGKAAAAAAQGGEQSVLVVPTDVSKLEEVIHLKETVLDAWGEVST